MKKITVSLLAFYTGVITLAIVVGSCSKTFDTPPIPVDPNITITKTIAQLKAMYPYSSTGNVFTIHDSAGAIPTVISGIVVGNDKSGNIYKQIYIQDSTGGLVLKLGSSNLYALYPVGMRVFVYCSGLSLSDYSGNVELGILDNSTPSTPAVTTIPSTLIRQYVIPGSHNNTITPKVVTITAINAAAKNNPYTQDTLQNTLIQINNLEFSKSVLGYVYSDTSANQANTSRAMDECSSNNTTVLYTSGYADFAAATLPAGGGTMLAIYVPYNAKSELILRDTTDINFNGVRCDGSSPVPPTGIPSGLISISTLRSGFGGSGIKVNSSQQITGVVISDASNKNLNASSAIIQQGTSAVTVYFGATVSFSIGDSVVIDISNDSLISYNGSLEVKASSAQLTATVKAASGKTITPAVVTIAQLNAALAKPLNDPGNIELTLVQIKNATVDATGAYYQKGVYPNLNDGAKIELYTNASATFASSIMPTTAQTWTGYASNYNTDAEFSIRNLNDVSGSGGSTVTPPTVTTTAISAITATSATSGGNVTSGGNATVTASGIVYSSTNTNPQIGGTGVTQLAATGGTDIFTSSLTGLTTGTLYYVSAYATNSSGTSYGSILSFTASAGSTPTSFTATYTFAGVVASGGGLTDPTPVPSVTGLTFGSFTSSVGTNSSATGRFSFTGWPTGATTGIDDPTTYTGAINTADYYQLTITPNAGTQLDLTNMTFAFRRSSTGIRMCSVRSSLDNYGSDLPASISPANSNLAIINYGGSPNVIFWTLDATTADEPGSTITFSGATGLTSPVTLRFYGFNAESAAGTFSMDNVVITGATH